MFFTGDIAQPFSTIQIPDNLHFEGVGVGNLEGSLIDVEKDAKKGVYNNFQAIKKVCSHIPFKAFCIANNHLLDSSSVSTTTRNSQIIGVPTFGAGDCINEAARSLVVKDYDGTSYRLLAFGWENIQCVTASTKQQGVNPYTKENVMECIKIAMKHIEPVICFMHWNYELEKYPQPYDRQLAFELIDMGVSAVVGCHAHRVQPIEFYKGRPIVYGLGNFMFYQGHYFDGKLRFPKFCEKEYVFEIADGGSFFRLHHLMYDSVVNKLEYVKSETITHEMDFDGKAEFTGFTAKKYEAWFTAHRVQKKMLPVFKAHESKACYCVKSLWIKIRGEMINLLTKMNLKSANRASRQ